MTRTEETESRPAGSTALVDGTIPDAGDEPGDDRPEAGPQEP